jgi:hypothetical protein
LRRLERRYARVDGIPFELLVACKNSPVLMAAFKINADRARALIPSHEVHPLRLLDGSGVLMVTVIDYRDTTIGKYIEYSIAIACTHGDKPAPRLLPALFAKTFGTGQWVLDLPVSSEISVKGGKGIWGMPKHRAPLNFVAGEDTASAQYDLDGQLATYIEIARPRWNGVTTSMSAANYCAFRGLLMKSYVHFTGKAAFALGRRAKARFVIGDHPRVQPLKTLEISEKPIFTVFIPSATGVLDDYFESWFLSFTQPPVSDPEGLPSVVGLGLSEEWPPPPSARVAK